MTEIFPAAPTDSELERWSEDGVRHAPPGSNVVFFESPEGRYGLRIEVDDPIRGYLIQLFDHDRDDDDPIAQTVVDHRDIARYTASEMVAAADELAALEERPRRGPPKVYREDIDHGQVEIPEEWENEAEEEWEEAVEDAFDKAEIPRAKGYLTQKEINDNRYYYLQWREGDSVKSQYVAPVNPSSSS